MPIKALTLAFLSSGWLTLGLSASAPAQEAPLADEATGQTFMPLPPSYHLNYDSSGGGYEGLGSVEAFFPFFQNPGNNLMFFSGRVLLDNGSSVSTNAMVGYRALDASGEYLTGIYLAFDTRETGANAFNQLSFGAELLSNSWDAHANVYLPLGEARQSIDGAAYFQNNNLLLPVQSAMTGFDLGVGTQLVSFDNGGDLRASADLYHYQVSGLTSTTGVRLGLEARPTPYFNIGGGVQYDELFGTNFVFRVGATFPPRPGRQDTARETVWARGNESVRRQSSIIVDERIEVVTNPATGNAYIFRHVNPATGTATGGNAAFETPRDTIANTVGIANSGDIIYVQAGNAGGAFTIPDGVQVRSVGPVQTVATSFGNVQLPGSGSGNLPAVNGTVTMGSDSVLSGFAIDPAGADGVVADGVSNISIEDNTITNANQGIYLPDIDGTVTIVRNQISNTADDGIYFDDIDGTDNTNITIANNTLTTIGDEGIEFDSIEGDARANISIANNQIINTQGNSIFFDAIQDNAVVIANISNNTINGGGVATDGIEFDSIEDNANATITILNNQISNTDDDGIYFNDFEDDSVINITVANNILDSINEAGIEFDNAEDDANVTISIANNQISNTGEDGIYFDSFDDDSQGTLTIAGNQITTVGDSGIELNEVNDNAVATITITDNVIDDSIGNGIYFDDVEENARATLTISRNRITNVGYNGIDIDNIGDMAVATITITENIIDTADNNGIYFDGVDDMGIGTITISNNQISNVVTDGIRVEYIRVDGTATMTISGNQITNAGDDGIEVEHDSTNDMCLVLENNTVITANNGFEFISTGAGIFQIINRANVTTANTGTFNPADIVTNVAFGDGAAGVAPCP